MPDRNYTFLVTMTPEQYDQVLPAMQQAKVRLDAAKLAEPEINTNAVHQGCNLYSLLEEVNTSGHPPQPNRDAIQDGDEAPQPLIQTDTENWDLATVSQFLQFCAAELIWSTESTVLDTWYQDEGEFLNTKEEYPLIPWAED